MPPLPDAVIACWRARGDLVLFRVRTGAKVGLKRIIARINIPTMHALDDTLFTDENPPRLVGGRDRATGRIVFPRPANDAFDAVPLRREGTLWSYTVQRFRPKTPPYAGPETFSPWIVAYVELPGETIVEARLTGVEPDALTIGMPLILTTVPLDPDAPGERLIPAFRPA